MSPVLRRRFPRRARSGGAFGIPFDSRAIVAFPGDLFELGGEFHRAAVIAGAHGKIEQAFERRRVLWHAQQHALKQVDGFLREPIA